MRAVAGDGVGVGDGAPLQQVAYGGGGAGQAGIGEGRLEKDVGLVDVCALLLHKILHRLTARCRACCKCIAQTLMSPFLQACHMSWGGLSFKDVAFDSPDPVMSST